MFFLNKCPWKVIEILRKRVPDVLFQMLLRSTNARVYTNYINSVVQKFCKQAPKSGVDVFRVFNSINYIKNLKLDIYAAGSAGGFVECNLSCTGDVSGPIKDKYNIEYYINLERDLANMGVHSLSVKYNMGLLIPPTSTMLVLALG